MLGVFALFALLRELGAGSLTASLASLMLYLSPRFFLVARTDRNTELPLVCSRPPIPPHSYPMTNNYDALPEEDRRLLTYSTDDIHAPYLIYNTTYMKIAGLSIPEGYRQLFSIEAYRHPIVIVYESNGVK